MNFLLEQISLRRSLVRVTSNMEGVFQTYVYPPTEGCVSICSIGLRATYRGSHPTASTVTATFDASLKGVGVVWHSNINGAEVAGCVAALDHSCLSFTLHSRTCSSSLELLWRWRASQSMRQHSHTHNRFPVISYYTGIPKDYTVKV